MRSFLANLITESVKRWTREPKLPANERKTKMAAKVDKEKCVGCGACKEACPGEAIEIKDGKAVVDEDKCLSCGACEGECPQEAIKVE